MSAATGRGTGAGEPAALALADPETRHDLATYITRARRLDPEGAARLVAAGPVLAAYVSPVHGGSGPTVLGLRTAALAEPAEADVTVALAALADRLALPHETALPLPPMTVGDAAWAGISPPRTGWELVTALDPAELSAVAAAGIAEVARTVPTAAGGHVVAQVRAAVWGRELASAPGVVAGAAYALDGLGFLDPQEAVAVRSAGRWWRLSSSRGHVLVRGSLL